MIIFSYCWFIVNGGWGKWAPFSKCTRICGGGNQIHVRVCDNPEPAYGGAPCHGNKEETQTCNIDPCPGIFQFRFSRGTLRAPGDKEETRTRHGDPCPALCMFRFR